MVDEKTLIYSRGKKENGYNLAEIMSMQSLKKLAHREEVALLLLNQRLL